MIYPLMLKRNISYDEKEDRAIFEFGQALPVGRGQLTIAFESVLNDDMAGFYKSKYIVNGETRYVERSDQKEDVREDKRRDSKTRGRD